MRRHARKRAQAFRQPGRQQARLAQRRAGKRQPGTLQQVPFILAHQERLRAIRPHLFGQLDRNDNAYAAMRYEF